MSDQDRDDTATKLTPPLPDFQLESELARELGCHERTLARPRKLGKFDFMFWAGRVWDHRPGVNEYLRSRVIRRNPPRNLRRRRSENRDSP